MSYFDDASLVMIPSGYKDQKVYSVKPLDGSGDLTFSRASSATRVASNGLIEKVRTNQYYKSTAFTTSSLYATYNVSPVSLGTYPVNSSSLAYSFSITGGNQGFIVQLANDTNIRALSVYLKDWNAVDLYWTGSAPLSDGYTSEVVNGYTRYVIVIPAGANNIYFRPNSNSGTVTTVYATAPQVEYGDIATSYIVNDTTASVVSVGPVSGLPRLDYLNSTCPRLLLEPQRTNLLTFSEQINNAAWLNAGGTTTANTAISPTGYQDADTLTGARYQTSFGSNTYTLSAFAKKVDGDGTFVLRVDVPANKAAVFNLNNGTIVSTDAGYTSTITSYGNGWYRCTLTSPASTAISNAVIISANAGVSSTFVYGCQLEVGAYATSYIPTLGASVTRVVETTSRSGLGLTNSTFVLNFQILARSVELFDFTKTGGGRMFYIAIQSGGFVTFNSVSGGSIGAIGTPLAINTSHKIAFTLNASTSNVGVFINGVKIGTYATDITTFGAFSALQTFGFDPASKVEQILIFPSVLSDSQAIELTA